MNSHNSHICFFNSHKEWGGGEKWHRDIVTFLFSKNHRVILCVNPRGKLFQHVSADIPKHSISLSNLSFLNPFAFITCYRMFKKYNVQTVILCLPIDVKVAGIAAKLAGVKNIVYRRGCAIPIKNKASNRFLFSQIITHVIANSQATKESVLACNPQLFPHDKITVLYNGIAIPQESAPRVANEHATVVIGTAGRLEPQKNMKDIVRIAHALASKTSNFCITIAGDGSQYQEIENYIAQLGVQNFVKLVGFQDNMSSFYDSLDMFILTSHGEGFGYVFAEAMAHNLPLVAYDVSSSQELIQDSYNGFLVPKDSIETFVSKILYLIEHPEQRIAMGNNSAAYVRKHFDENNTNLKIEAYITQL